MRGPIEQRSVRRRHRVRGGDPYDGGIVSPPVADFPRRLGRAPTSMPAQGALRFYHWKRLPHWNGLFKPVPFGREARPALFSLCKPWALWQDREHRPVLALALALGYA